MQVHETLETGHIYYDRPTPVSPRVVLKSITFKVNIARICVSLKRSL